MLRFVSPRERERMEPVVRRKMACMDMKCTMVDIYVSLIVLFRLSSNEVSEMPIVV